MHSSTQTNLSAVSSYMLTGRAIYTMDDARPKVEAVGVVGERIVAVGTVDEVRALLPSGARRIDMGERMVLPGFTDSHNHFAYLARKWQAVNLDDCATPGEALARVEAFLREKPDVAWVDGHGWDPNRWERLPTRFDLDRIAADRPVALTSKDGHALWANSAALIEAGLLQGGAKAGGAKANGTEVGGAKANGTEAGGAKANGTRAGGAEPGGTSSGDNAKSSASSDLDFDPALIARDPASGEPTGILYETAAKYVLRFLPAPSPRDVAEAVAAGVPRLHAQGITAVHCPELVDDWRAYRMLRRAGRLGVRITFWLPVDMLERAIELGLATGVGDEWLRFGPVKLFADGTLGQRTAAMLAPYEGEPDNRGVLLYSDEELTRLARRAAQHEFAVAIHAIGDRAVRQALDALEAARAVPGTKHLRHRIEHVQIVHPDDAVRLAALDVVASMQPLHCPADRVNADKYWGERTGWAFAFRTFKDAGATLAFGSDAPFGLDLTTKSFSVLAGIDAAVNRTTPRAWRRAALDPSISESGSAPGGATPDGRGAASGTVPDGRGSASGTVPKGRGTGPRPSSDGIAAVGATEEDTPWHPEQRLTLDEALRAFTIDAARAGGEEAWRGSLRPGNVADFVVLSDDLHRMAPERIGEARVVATVVAGRLVYGELPE